jgi:hypothetical protein
VPRSCRARTARWSVGPGTSLLLLLLLLLPRYLMPPVRASPTRLALHMRNIHGSRSVCSSGRQDGDPELCVARRRDEETEGRGVGHPVPRPLERGQQVAPRAVDFSVAQRPLLPRGEGNVGRGGGGGVGAAGLGVGGKEQGQALSPLLDKKIYMLDTAGCQQTLAHTPYPTPVLLLLRPFLLVLTCTLATAYTPVASLSPTLVDDGSFSTTPAARDIYI